MRPELPTGVVALLFTDIEGAETSTGPPGQADGAEIVDLDAIISELSGPLARA
jgi:hypothetical protein